MRVYKLFLAGAGVILVLILCVACACRGNGILKITVADSSGNVLWGAKVVSENQPAGQLKIEGITEEEYGGVLFNDIKSGKYQIQISRYGFAPETIDVTVNQGKTTNIDVVLFYASPPPVT
jgi:hypothetical protein